MRKAILCVTILFLAVPPLAAQDDQTASFVYEAYYSVAGSEMEDWNRQYREYSVPVLTALVEEGLIEGFGQQRHHTGGDDYNIRFVVRTYDWASLNTFWGEYLSRLRDTTPEAEWAASGRSVAKHRDEIWDIEEIQFGEAQGADVSHMYAASYLVNFQDMREWNEVWGRAMKPVLAAAVQEGILAGWVKLDHNTGGPHNAKFLYFVDDWDRLDALFRKAGDAREGNADAWNRFSGLTRAHDDNIWVPVSNTGM